MGSSSRSASPRLAFVDALRGIAAVYVALYHLALLPKWKLTIPHWASTFVLAGGTGVTLFFVLSAFSLCFTMPRHATEQHPIVGFYLRRFFRIAPLFYVMMLYSMGRDWFVFGVLHSPRVILASVFFVFNLMPGYQEGFVWASWTIGVEMLFYLVFPFIYRFCDNLWNIIAIFIGLLLTAIVVRAAFHYLPMSLGEQNEFFRNSIFRHAAVFVLGFFCFFAFSKWIQQGKPSRELGLALILSSIFGYYSLLHGGLKSVIFEDQYYWQPIIYSLLILGLSICPVRLLVNSVTKYLGKISYSVYLIHTSVIYFLSPVYARINMIKAPASLTFLGAAILTLVLTVAISEVTYKIVERPGERLGKAVGGLLNKRRGRELGTPTIPAIGTIAVTAPGRHIESFSVTQTRGPMAEPNAEIAACPPA